MMDTRGKDEHLLNKVIDRMLYRVESKKYRAYRQRQEQLQDVDEVIAQTLEAVQQELVAASREEIGIVDVLLAGFDAFRSCLVDHLLSGVSDDEGAPPDQTPVARADRVSDLVNQAIAIAGTDPRAAVDWQHIISEAGD